jgi:hypothetical protein
MEMVDLPRLMELLGYADYAHRLDFSCQGKQAADGSYIVDTDTIKGFWLKDDCDIEKSGIKAKSLEDNLFKQLTDSEQKARSDFEKDIRLDLPCSLDEVKAWAQRNDFGDLLDESELLKERQKAVAEIKANRAAKPNLSNQELLDNHLSDLIQKSGLQNAGEFEYSFILYVWKRQLVDEREMINPKDYPDRKNYDDRMRALNFKIAEIDQNINSRPVSNAVAQAVVEWNETLINGQPIDWGYWKDLNNLTPAQAAKLVHMIDPILWTDDRYAAGKPYDERYNGEKIGKDLSVKIQRLELRLENHSLKWSLVDLVDFLGEDNVPFGMLQVVEDLAKIETEEHIKAKESEFQGEAVGNDDAGSQTETIGDDRVRAGRYRERDLDAIAWLAEMKKDKTDFDLDALTIPQIETALKARNSTLWGKGFSGWNRKQRVWPKKRKGIKRQLKP